MEYVKTSRSFFFAEYNKCQLSRTNPRDGIVPWTISVINQPTTVAGIANFS